jgi:hypothetical protein
LVEHATENRSVGGSIPPLGTIFASSIDDELIQQLKPPVLQYDGGFHPALRRMDATKLPAAYPSRARTSG